MYVPTPAVSLRPLLLVEKPELPQVQHTGPGVVSHTREQRDGRSRGRKGKADSDGRPERDEELQSSVADPCHSCSRSSGNPAAKRRTQAPNSSNECSHAERKRRGGGVTATLQPRCATDR